MRLQYLSSARFCNQIAWKILRNSLLLISALPSTTQIEPRALDLFGHITSQGVRIEVRIKFWLNFKGQVSLKKQ